MRIDMLLKGGRVIDPAADRDAAMDVAVSDGKIVAVEPNIPAAAAREVIDVAGKLVLPGMIDTHAHVYEGVTGKFGLSPDMVGVQSAVTTVIDQGGPSCMTIPGFRQHIVERSETRVLCFISAYLVGGLEGHLYPDLYGPTGVNIEHTVRAAKENRDLVRGIKAHAETGGVSRWGLEVIKLGKQMARETGLPLYIHLGQLWPVAEDNPEVDADEVVRELLPMMDAGDIMAHPFTRHPGGFISQETGEVHPVVWAALERGVTVDVGHGSHFDFDMAQRVMAAGIKPFTLGADMHGYNVRVPNADAKSRSANPFFGVAPFSLTVAMTELLTLGMALSEIAATVTANPAKMIGMSDTLGTLSPGREADVSVLHLIDGRFELQDNSGHRVEARQMILPAFALRAGRRVDATSPLIPAPLKMAA